MKLFSWSGLVYLLSLSFIWSCGYWLYLQTGSWHLVQQKNELTQQLDKAQTLLQNWQQGYQLHLSYLATELEQVQQVQQDTAETSLTDPLQQLDEQIRRVLWPDPLLSYVVLDSAGLVRRFSDTPANSYFSQTRLEPAAATFLPPILLKEQWLFPLRVHQAQQQLVLYFDAARLQDQLQRLMASSSSPVELLLLSADAEILSRSRYQKSLLPRLGLDGLDEHSRVQIFAKKPPEPLLQSRQRYLDPAAWPDTVLARELQRQPTGFISRHYLNYLGRPTLAMYRKLDHWPLSLVAERDAGPMLKQLAQVKMQLLAGLAVLSLFLTLLFWLLHRRLTSTELLPPDAIQHPAEGQSDLAEYEPPVLGELAVLTADDESSAESDRFGFSTVTNSAGQLPTAAGIPQQDAPTMPGVELLLQAWLQQPHLDPKLADISRSWLAQSAAPMIDERWIIDPLTELTCSLQQWSQQYPQISFLLESGPDVPAALVLHKSMFVQLIELICQDAVRRSGSGCLHFRLMMAETEVLQLELLDQAHPRSAGQWLAALEPRADEPGPDAKLYRQVRQLCEVMSAQLSAAPVLSSGNKIVLLLPCQLPPQRQQPVAPILSGSAMLLCPPGENQQLYRRILRSCGLNLLPMDDASQLMQWCESSPDELSKMLIDEDFVKGDSALAGKIATVVRRYFPQVQFIISCRQTQPWQHLVETANAFLLLKPVTQPLLWRALTSRQPGVVEPPVEKIWIYHPDPVRLWWIEQIILSLRCEVQVIRQWPELPGDITQDYYCLDESLIANLEPLLLPRLLIHCQEQTRADVQQPDICWSLSSGPAGLSRALHQLGLLRDATIRRNDSDEPTF